MSDIASYVYFQLVYTYLQKQINTFGMNLMHRTMTWAATIALTLVTLWILIQGFRIMTGRSQAPLMEVVINMGRIVVIVAAATTMAVTSTDLNDFFTTQLDQEVHYLFTGNKDETTASAIDQNLAYTQLALSSIDSVQVLDRDSEMVGKKERTALMATIGTASPPMAAGAMLLLYQFAMALFIGLGPLFILCLIFDQTKDLFRRWLMYGVGTIFSMALLSAVASMVLGLTLRISVAMWGAKIINNVLKIDTDGLTSTAIQQGGIGLLLSLLIISVPPMAAMFFQGTLGSALTYSVFDRNGGKPGPQGQPAGMIQASSTPHTNAGGHSGHGGFDGRVAGTTSVTPRDEVKSTRTV
jgi:type IV secretion system protein VirB6